MPTLVLSALQAGQLLLARDEGQVQVTVSLDLGCTQEVVTLDTEGVWLDPATHLSWEGVSLISDHPQVCFEVSGSEPHKIQQFSPTFNRFYSLMPTTGAPTLLISGIPMHRVKDVDPMQDTRNKIRAATPRGRVLDTATGLGYTAIQAAQRADQVITIELDPVVLEIARLNPWSQLLFSTPHIEQRVGDSAEFITSFPAGSFDRIIHDPPMLSLAGHLYSADYYRQLHRILRPGGRLFHYVGDPESKSGRNTTSGVSKRLRSVGFRRIQRHPQAFGLVAFR